MNITGFIYEEASQHNQQKLPEKLSLAVACSGLQLLPRYDLAPLTFLETSHTRLQDKVSVNVFRDFLEQNLQQLFHLI